MAGKSIVYSKLMELKETVRKWPYRDYQSLWSAKKYAARTNRLIREGVKAMGKEAGETEQMTRSFFQLLGSKLDLSGRTTPPSEEEVKAAIEQLKDMGRLSIFTTLVILPGGVISLLGLELLARKFGVKGFNLVPSSFRNRKNSRSPAR